MGGSFNDDASIVGGPPKRDYFNDVWKSRNGEQWELATRKARWAARAGAVVVEKDGNMWLSGGEDGFLCDPMRPDSCPPYCNDVWRSRDGARWEQVTANANRSSRPGHQVVVHDHFVLFGGFGISPDPADPFRAANPMDIWVSRNGAHWRRHRGHAARAQGACKVEHLARRSAARDMAEPSGFRRVECARPSRGHAACA
jgi:hypothetical protein